MATTSSVNYFTNITPLTGGIAGSVSYGPTWRVTIGGTWVAFDAFTFDLVTDVITYTLGAGRVTGLTPVNCLTLQDRVHFIAGTSWLGSENGDPTLWEQQSAGAFSISVAGQNQQTENLVSLAPFQGKMMLASRNTTQLWAINADPNQVSQVQVLSNIGTAGTFSAQSLGDFDVLFVSDSGLRSLRVMTINLNGFITDLGSPIDSLITNEVLGQTTTQLSNIISIVEPTAKRFFLYCPKTATIYVLSYFPTEKIIAWSTFKCTMHGGVTFVPSTFKVLNSIVYFRALNNSAVNFIGCYGTSDGSTTTLYDDTQPVVVQSWLDNKTPGERKQAIGVDAVIQGQWTISGSMDYYGVTVNAESLKVVANQLNAGSTGTYASQQKAMIGWSDDGFHVQLKAVADATTNPSTLKKLSELIFYYKTKGQK